MDVDESIRQMLRLSVSCKGIYPFANEPTAISLQKSNPRDGSAGEHKRRLQNAMRGAKLSAGCLSRVQNDQRNIKTVSREHFQMFLESRLSVLC